jgi:hypothetical protein
MIVDPRNHRPVIQRSDGWIFQLQSSVRIRLPFLVLVAQPVFLTNSLIEHHEETESRALIISSSITTDVRAVNAGVAQIVFSSHVGLGE